MQEQEKVWRGMEYGKVWDNNSTKLGYKATINLLEEEVSRSTAVKLAKEWQIRQNLPALVAA